MLPRFGAANSALWYLIVHVEDDDREFRSVDAEHRQVFRCVDVEQLHQRFRWVPMSSSVIRCSVALICSSSVKHRHSLRSWPVAGPLLGRCWTVAGPLLGRCWPAAAPLLARCCAVAGPSLAHCWAVAGPLLARCWPVAGPLLAVDVEQRLQVPVAKLTSGSIQCFVVSACKVRSCLSLSRMNCSGS